MNNINLILRFLLEVVAFLAPAFYIASLTEGFLSIILPPLSALTLTLLWGIFAVPNDPSRSGKTVVKTPGWIRLVLELAIFGFGGWCLWEMGFRTSAFIYGAVVIIHNLMFYERNMWLIRQ